MTWRRISIATGLGLVLFVTGAAAQVGGEPKPIDFIPEVPIPGLFEGTIQVDSRLLANYLRAVYIYFIWSVGVLATVMVVYGGIKWVSAAGNPARINDARETINNAIIGVIIALTSVVMLNIIDPNYTRFGLPDLRPVPGEQLGACPDVKNADGTCKPTSEIPCGHVCIDPTKGNVYGDCKYCDSTQADRDTNRCGFMKEDPCALAKDGNCVYTRCEESDMVCEKIQVTIPKEHACSAQARLASLAEAGYADLQVQYDRGFACATISWSEDGIPPFEVERLKIGTKCEGDKNCVVDYTISPKVTVRYSEIPNNSDKYQIGQYEGSCY